MKKISTLFKKNPSNLQLVINEINPENQWVFDDDGIPTRKYDGSACAIINDELYKRYDAKLGRKVPEGAIPCQEADIISGHHPHWIKCHKHKHPHKVNKVPVEPDLFYHLIASFAVIVSIHHFGKHQSIHANAGKYMEPMKAGNGKKQPTECGCSKW